MIIHDLIQSNGNYKLSIVYCNWNGGNEIVILEPNDTEEMTDLCQHFEGILDGTYEEYLLYEKYIKQTKGIFVQEVRNGDIFEAIEKLDSKISNVLNSKEEFNRECNYFINAMKMAKAVHDVILLEHDVCYGNIDFSKELGGLK